MRGITEHRFEGGGFDDAVRNLVRSSPWWMISLVVHLVVLAVLWSIPYDTRADEPAAHMQASIPRAAQEPEQDVVQPPEQPEPKEKIVEEPTDIDVEQPPSEDTDDFNDEPEGIEGLLSGPLTGPSKNTAIGLGPGAGGGKGTGGHRRAELGGGGGLTQDAVLLGLKWLADHQDVDEDGKWDCDDFMKHDPADDRCDGAGGALYDVGVTGLALLAFLGANHTDRGTAPRKPFARNVRRGLLYLLTSQDGDGVFGARATHSYMYNHAIATLAMCEAYWMTRNPRYKKPAQDGLNYLAMARNPYMAWRYEPRGGENDTSITGWCVMALKSGKFAGLQVDPDALEGARLWIDKMTEPNFGQVGYNFTGGVPARPPGKQDRFPAEKSQSMTAVGILSRVFLGEDPRTSDPIRKGTALCLEILPTWNPDDGSIDMYYWYYGTLALFQVGGKPWRRWNKAMTEAIVESQHPRKSGARTGSWDPIGAWGDDGGRVYSTAMLTMCLEVYYRYDKVFGTR